MAWLAEVRFAPLALSSITFSKSTRSLLSFWNFSRFLLFTDAEPLISRNAILFASNACATLEVRSGNWTKMRTRSSFGILFLSFASQQ